MSEEPTRNSEERSTIDVVLGNPNKRWQFVGGNVAAAALSLLGGVAVRGAIMWGNSRARGRRPFSRHERRSGAEPLLPTCVYFGGLVLKCSPSST
jgi:hypothetical protein